MTPPRPFGPGEIRPGVARLFRLAARRGAGVQDEVDDEIRLHLQLRAAQLARDEGLAPEAARAEAERRFGPLHEARERLHASAERREGRMHVRELLDAVRHDLRVAVRGLRRAPGLVVTAVLSLALGVGANAALFSLFDQLLVRPLPVAEPERLVRLVVPGGRWGTTACSVVDCDESFSYPMFRDLERAAGPRVGLAGLAAHAPLDVNLAAPAAARGATGGRTLHARAVLVSGGYFPALGVRPALGRLLGPADDRALGAHPVAVVGYDYWRAELGGDPGAVGRTLAVNGYPLTVVGVAPRGFTGTTLGRRPQLFVPLAMTRQVGQGMPGMDGFDTSRRTYWLFAFGRLAPGVAREDASRALGAVYRPIITDVEAALHPEMTAREMAQFRRAPLQLEPGGRGQSTLPGQVRLPLVLLSAVAGVVLLIACANIAGLLLARGAARGMEVAVRVSLGAGRRRVAAQLLTEALVLAALGGAAGLLVARGTLALAAAILPPGAAGAVEPALDWRVVLAVAALAAGAGLVFGLVPAVQSTRADLVRAIRANAGQIAGARAAARFRTALVGGQIALATVLLVAAGLFLRSLRNVTRVELGVAADRFATVTLAPELNGYAPERRKQLFARVEAALAAVPGVTGVAATRVPLLAGALWGTGARIDGVRTEPGADNGTAINLVGPGAFRMLGVPQVAGREFTPADREGAPGVAVVNEAFARKFGLGLGVVGRRLAVWGDPEPSLEVVGVVRNAKYDAVKGEPQATVYTALRQDARLGTVTYYVRTAGDPARLLPRIAAAVAAVDPDVPAQDLKTLPEQVRENVAVDRMIGTLSAAFAGLATLLAAVGLYGVLAYSVAQRGREIAVRMAVGADARRVRALVLRQVGRMTLAGGAVGLVAALALGRAARSLLFGLGPHDPAAVAAAAGVLAAVALGAAYLPARRASRVEPMRALRGE
jgi:predicted permease